MMIQYYINRDMYDEDYQQIYVGEQQIEESGTELTLTRGKTGSVIRVAKAACVVITEEEYNRLNALDEASAAYGRTAWNIITTKQHESLQTASN